MHRVPSEQHGLMKLHHAITLILALTATFSAAVHAAQGLHDTFNPSLACKSHFISALFDQQVRFSNSHLTPNERRDAENRIDNARSRLEQTHDYCKALEELGKDTYSHLDVEMGDIHEFHGAEPIHNG
ncbi:hypothetical protein NF212_00640 [Parasalinivibrio latis]|uniref:hypothetical protein n=1 Tax=Parasalinivibrio latis TaxID=2952610 RepID=UPI0030E0013B